MNAYVYSFQMKLTKLSDSVSDRYYCSLLDNSKWLCVEIFVISYPQQSQELLSELFFQRGHQDNSLGNNTKVDNTEP